MSLSQASRIAKKPAAAISKKPATAAAKKGAAQAKKGKVGFLSLSTRTLVSGCGNHRALVFMCCSFPPLRSPPSFSPGPQETSELASLAA